MLNSDAHPCENCLLQRSMGATKERYKNRHGLAVSYSSGLYHLLAILRRLTRTFLRLNKSTEQVRVVYIRTRSAEFY